MLLSRLGPKVLCYSEATQRPLLRLDNLEERVGIPPKSEELDLGGDGLPVEPSNDSDGQNGNAGEENDGFAF